MSTVCSSALSLISEELAEVKFWNDCVKQHHVCLCKLSACLVSGHTGVTSHGEASRISSAMES